MILKNYAIFKSFSFFPFEDDNSLFCVKDLATRFPFQLEECWCGVAQCPPVLVGGIRDAAATVSGTEPALPAVRLGFLPYIYNDNTFIHIYVYYSDK